jgi:hypothetical protein
MQTREAKVKGGRGRRGADIDQPQNNYPNTADALRDLARFIQGQEHMPDAALQFEDLVSDLDLILDDEVVASLEDMFEDCIFQDIPDGDSSFNMRKRKAFELMKKLRDLQKTRLRDAIARAVVHKFS